MLGLFDAGAYFPEIDSISMCLVADFTDRPVFAWINKPEYIIRTYQIKTSLKYF